VSDADREDFMQPQLIAGRYQVLRAIGRGGMGTVWLCRDEILGREVAIKQIGALPGESMTETKRAMREARSAAALNHPNAVAVYDVVDHDGLPWLVMEYVEGQTLADEILNEGRLAPQRVADIGAQLAGALARAHERRIIHRDIKPGNVLIDRAGRPKISDFGIARGHGDEQLTQVGFITGTPGYLSPELARGADPAPASDVWALGATLYAAVEGQPPYEQRSNPIAMLRMIATERPRPMDHAGALAPAIEAMMHEDPARRWDMATSARRLGGIARITTVLPRPDPAPTAVMPDVPLDSTQPFQPTQRAPKPKVGRSSGQTLLAPAPVANPPAAGPPANPPAASPPAKSPAAEPTAATPAARPPVGMAPSESRVAQKASPPAAPPVTKPPAATRSVAGVPVTERLVQAPAGRGQTPDGQSSNGQGSNGQGSNGQGSNGQGSNGQGPSRQSIRGQEDAESLVPGAGSRSRRGGRRLLPVLLVAALLAVFALAYVFSQLGGQPGPTASKTTKSAPATQAAKKPAPSNVATQAPVAPAPQAPITPRATVPVTPAPRASVTPRAPAPVAPAPTSRRAVDNFVRSYYANVTRNTSQTWNQLTPAMRAAAGGRSGYEGFWRTINRVRINRTQVNASGTAVTVNLTYFKRGGGTATETHRFTIVNRNGRYLIENERRGG
jgi:serine/threonine protein kinase